MAMSNASRSRLIFAAAMMVAAYFIYTAAEGALRAHSVSQNRNQAEERVAQLEAKKSYLEAVKEYVGSDSYVEQEARRRLGYTRDGEVPFVVIGPAPSEDQQASGEWWERLFPR